MTLTVPADLLSSPSIHPRFLIERTFANFKPTRIYPDNRLTVPRFVDTSLIIRHQIIVPECYLTHSSSSFLHTSRRKSIESKILFYGLLYDPSMRHDEKRKKG